MNLLACVGVESLLAGSNLLLANETKHWAQLDRSLVSWKLELLLPVSFGGGIWLQANFLCPTKILGASRGFKWAALELSQTLLAAGRVHHFLRCSMSLAHVAT